jgi:hypothetical protein
MDPTEPSITRIELTQRATGWVVGLGAVLIILAVGLLRAVLEGALNGVLISLCLIGALGWIMATQALRRVSLLADRETGTLRITAQTPRWSSTQEFSLSDLRRVEVETRHQRSHSLPEPRLVLILDEGAGTRRERIEMFRPEPIDLLHAANTLNSWLTPTASDLPKTTHSQEPHK